MKVKQESGASGDYTWSGLGSDYNEDQNGVRVAKFMPPFNLKMAIFWNYFWEDSRDICKGNFCFLRILSHFNMEVFEIWGGEELCNSVRSCQCPHERLYIKVKGYYVETLSINDKYKMRPKEIHHMTLIQFIKCYALIKGGQQPNLVKLNHLV